MQYSVIRGLIRKELWEIRRDILACLPIVALCCMLPAMYGFAIGARLDLAARHPDVPIMHVAFFFRASFVVAMLGVLGISYSGAYAVVGERERGTLETLLASPATDAEIFLGKVTASVMIGVACMSLSAIVMTGVLLLVAHGASLSSLGIGENWPLFIICLPLYLSAASVVCCISRYARSSRLAAGLSGTFVILALTPFIYFMNRIVTSSIETKLLIVGLSFAVAGGCLALGSRLFRAMRCSYS